MRKSGIHLHRDERGVAAVEAIFVLIILAMVFFGAIEFGRAYTVKHSLDAGVYRAARYLSLNPSDLATATSLVRNEVSLNLGSSLASQVSVSVNMPSSAFQSQFTVSASVPWTPLSPIPYLIVTGKTLSAAHTQTIERYP